MLGFPLPVPGDQGLAAHRRPEIPFSDALQGTCRWCGEEILHASGPRKGEPNLRRRWHPACVDVYNQSDPREARRLIRKRDRGFCADCGLDTYALRRRIRGRGSHRKLRELGFLPRRSLWELDHIVPLVEGGSHHPTNLQTLCVPCHRSKSVREAAGRRAGQRPEASKADPEAEGSMSSGARTSRPSRTSGSSTQ
ncbi:MAG: HNH endonuclease signature motif containing protein [Myxococcota bacterium]